MLTAHDCETSLAQSVAIKRETAMEIFGYIILEVGLAGLMILLFGGALVIYEFVMALVPPGAASITAVVVSVARKTAMALIAVAVVTFVLDMLNVPEPIGPSWRAVHKSQMPSRLPNL